MGKAKQHTRRNVKRLRVQTRLLNGTNRLLLAAVFLTIAVVVWFIYVPQKRTLAKLQNDLYNAQVLLEKAEGLKEDRRIMLRSLKEDSEYLEIQSRDRLPWYKPGEMIFRIER